MNGDRDGEADRRRSETNGETEEVGHEVVRADNQLPNAPGSTSPSSASRRRRRRRPLIVCDCAYGWPSQKRPRNERVRAVARQLRNFLDWRENDDDRRREDDYDDNVHSEVVVIGAEEDLRPLRERLDVLASTSASASGLVFRSGTSVRECVAEHLSRETEDDDPPTRSEDEEENDATESLTRATERLRVTNDDGDDERSGVVAPLADGDAVVAYLSPDAPRALDPASAPPDVVVVGMLVDRRVTPGRSRRRAESAGVDSARLPLGAVFASSASRDDDEREPLNIDTVLEIVERWRWLRRDDGTKDERAFVEAATRALRRHRERHPNQQELRQKRQEART